MDLIKSYKVTILTGFLFFARFSLDELISLEATILHHLFFCELEAIFKNVMRNMFHGYTKSLSDYHSCISPKFEGSSCTSLLSELCKSSRIRVFKVVRFHMRGVQKLLQTDPNLGVIFYTRDPRAIMRSRMKIHRGMNISERADILCKKMRDDIKDFRELWRHYPENVLGLKYEDLSFNPLTTALKLYNFIGIPMPAEVQHWIGNNTQGEYNIRDPMGTKKNSSVAATYWKRILVDKVRKKIEYVCEDVINSLGYPNY